MRYIIKRKGKQMRPLFVFLSAQTVAGGEQELGERSHIAASLIELLHTATLVHDDVVDESPLRRGFFSIQALWKKKIAVLVGDYLLSRGLLMAVDREAYDLLKITSEAVRFMSEGELLQIEKARRLDITEEVYFDIIQRKTASLIAACCAWAASVRPMNEGNAEEVERMRKFGEPGLAFQIKDDLLDLGEGERIGKPTGGDIRERKMTLPSSTPCKWPRLRNGDVLSGWSNTATTTPPRSKKSWMPSSKARAWSTPGTRCANWRKKRSDCWMPTRNRQPKRPWSTSSNSPWNASDDGTLAPASAAALSSLFSP